MSPFKSSAGRQLGKLVEGFKSSTIGQAFGAGAVDLKYEVEVGGSGNYSVLSTDGNYNYYVFNNPGSFTITALNQPLRSRIAVIAGGGSGAGYNAAYFAGNNGNPSTAFGFTAEGGGAGAVYPGNTGGPGGSGGGGSVSGTGGAGNKQTGTTTDAVDIPQGNPGGAGASTYSGGGGGGAGLPGNDGVEERSAAGGLGIILEMDKTGSATGQLIPASLGTPGPIQGRWFGGGGGGGGGSTANTASAIEGGAGGGGKGAGPTLAQPETAGQDNTGGGGGGWEDGGGGGGAGGGGAGGVVQKTKTFTPDDLNLSYPISVGSGGTAGNANATNTGGSGIVLVRIARFRVLND